MPKPDAVTLALLRARERITDPTRWTVGRMAVDAHGLAIAPTRPEAVRWCAIGALRAVCRPGAVREQAHSRLSEAAAVVAPTPDGAGRLVSAINDLLGHTAVLALYDEAIRTK